MEKTTHKFTDTEAFFLPLFVYDTKSLTYEIQEDSGSFPANRKISGIQDDPYIRECMQQIISASNSVLPLIDDLATIAKPKGE